MKKLGILLSGRGSNFEALAKNVQSGKIPGEIAIVISNKPDAKGLEIAQSVEVKKAGFKSFLTDVLGVSAEQAEIDSCKIEHLISHETSDRLARFMEKRK